MPRYYMVFFCHREVGYIDTALHSQHYIILTQWVSFLLPGINFFGILQSLRHKSWLTERKKDADSWLKATEPTDMVCLDPTPIHFIMWLTGSISHMRTELSCRQIMISLTFHGQIDSHNWDQQTESWIFNKLPHTSKESILKQQSNLVKQWPPIPVIISFTHGYRLQKVLSSAKWCYVVWFSSYQYFVEPVVSMYC